jgi:hypothetical protein
MKSSKSWTSAGLLPGFERKVAGYDARHAVAAIEVQPPGLVAAKLIDIETRRWCPAAIDPAVWPRIAAGEREADCNGLNLFPTLSMANEVLGLEPDGVLVAFDFPSGLIESVATTFGLNALTEAEITSSWKFLGYDIVDIRTQSSAMYSFDWTRDEWIAICESVKFAFNRFGLVQEEALAISQATEFDEKVREHAPFAPCGVWIRSAARAA